MRDSMAKMTKAKARRRLREAAEKVNKVMFVTDLSLSSRDNNELSKIWDRLRAISNKLK